MSLSILNNIAALYAQNNINSTQTNLQKTLQQLSSGSRINSGADDPSGLAVADGMAANVAALSQSATNATSGIGLLQTADGALSQVTSLLDQAVTLATEASNGTLTNNQVSSANQEYQNIITQIGNIGSTTNFNSNKVFTGANVSVVVTDGTSSGLNQYNENIASLTTGSVGVGVTTAASTGGVTANTTAAASTSGTTSVPASNTFTLAAGDTLSGTLHYQVGASGTPGTVALGSTPLSLDATILALNANETFHTTNGLTASKSGTNLVITGADSTSTNGDTAIDTTGGSLQTTTPVVPGATTIGSGADFTAAGVATLNSTTAAAVLTTVTAAVADVAFQRGTLGADINELTSAAGVASAESVNLDSASNSVTATDYGAAASNLSKYQILSQTGISALAQANSVQQEVLKLLQ